jgi:hypothetical protein
MLQPRTYPELIGKALVLEAEPFIAMVDDDEPWAEGLFLTVCIGIAVGLAQLVGGLLTTASFPPAAAILETLLQGWQQLGLTLGLDTSQAERALRQTWDLFTLTTGLGGGWLRLFVLVATPFGLVLTWFIYGALAHLTSRWLGGTGTFNQTLGATALMAAPNALLLATVVPMATVGRGLLAVWTLLIVYRAVAVSHDLPWRRAAVAAATPFVLLIVLSVLFALSALAFSWGGAA